ncbi:MAG: alpha/beta hydrolase [Rhodobacteraceae bacterium]|nr:alpha/beta hydrolase [Paracoccaceae bacterium]
MSPPRRPTASPPPNRRAALGMIAAAWAAPAALSACAAAPTEPVEARYPPLGQFVAIPGGRLHYLDRPGLTPEAPAIVLIHGASGNLRDFAFDLMGRLPRTNRVIAVDRPGLGHSDRGALADAHRPDVQAKLIRDALAGAGVSRAVVVGHSFGAAPALAWALDAPESVAGVGTLAGATHPFPGGVGFMYEMLASDLFGGVATALAGTFFSEEGVGDAIARIFKPQSAPEGYIEYVGAGLALRPDTLRWNAEDLTQLNGFLTLQQPRYPEISASIEIIHGEADDVVSLKIHGAQLAQEAPRARLTALPGVGHMPHHAAPEACVAAIQRLVDQA